MYMPVVVFYYERIKRYTSVFLRSASGKQSLNAEIPTSIYTSRGYVIIRFPYRVLLLNTFKEYRTCDLCTCKKLDKINYHSSLTFTNVVSSCLSYVSNNANNIRVKPMGHINLSSQIFCVV